MGQTALLKAPGIDLIPLMYWKHPKTLSERFFEELVVVRDVRKNYFRRCGYFVSNDTLYKRSPYNPEFLIRYMEQNDSITLI